MADRQARSAKCWLVVIVLVALSCSDLLAELLTGIVYLLAYAAGCFSASGIWFSVAPPDQPAEPPEDDVPSGPPAGALIAAVLTFAIGVMAWGQPVVEAIANLCGLSDDIFGITSSEISSDEITSASILDESRDPSAAENIGALVPFQNALAITEPSPGDGLATAGLQNNTQDDAPAGQSRRPLSSRFSVRRDSLTKRQANQGRVQSCRSLVRDQLLKELLDESKKMGHHLEVCHAGDLNKMDDEHSSSQRSQALAFTVSLSSDSRTKSFHAAALSNRSCPSFNSLFGDSSSHKSTKSEPVARHASGGVPSDFPDMVPLGGHVDKLMLPSNSIDATVLNSGHEKEFLDSMDGVHKSSSGCEVCGSLQKCKKMLKPALLNQPYSSSINLENTAAQTTSYSFEYLQQMEPVVPVLYRKAERAERLEWRASDVCCSSCSTCSSWSRSPNSSFSCTSYSSQCVSLCTCSTCTPRSPTLSTSDSSLELRRVRGGRKQSYSASSRRHSLTAMYPTTNVVPKLVPYTSFVMRSLDARVTRKLRQAAADRDTSLAFANQSGDHTPSGEHHIDVVVHSGTPAERNGRQPVVWKSNEEDKDQASSTDSNREHHTKHVRRFVKRHSKPSSFLKLKNKPRPGVVPNRVYATKKTAVGVPGHPKFVRITSHKRYRRGLRYHSRLPTHQTQSMSDKEEEELLAAVLKLLKNQDLVHSSASNSSVEFKFAHDQTPDKVADAYTTTDDLEKTQKLFDPGDPKRFRRPRRRNKSPNHVEDHKKTKLYKLLVKESLKLKKQKAAKKIGKEADSKKPQIDNNQKETEKEEEKRSRRTSDAGKKTESRRPSVSNEKSTSPKASKRRASSSGPVEKRMSALARRLSGRKRRDSLPPPGKGSGAEKKRKSSTSIADLTNKRNKRPSDFVFPKPDKKRLDFLVPKHKLPPGWPPWLPLSSRLQDVVIKPKALPDTLFSSNIPKNLVLMKSKGSQTDFRGSRSGSKKISRSVSAQNSSTSAAYEKILTPRPFFRARKRNRRIIGNAVATYNRSSTYGGSRRRRTTSFTSFLAGGLPTTKRKSSVSKKPKRRTITLRQSGSLPAWPTQPRTSVQAMHRPALRSMSLSQFMNPDKIPSVLQQPRRQHSRSTVQRIWKQTDIFSSIKSKQVESRKKGEAGGKGVKGGTKQGPKPSKSAMSVPPEKKTSLKNKARAAKSEMQTSVERTGRGSTPAPADKVAEILQKAKISQSSPEIRPATPPAQQPANNDKLFAVDEGRPKTGESDLITVLRAKSLKRSQSAPKVIMVHRDKTEVKVKKSKLRVTSQSHLTVLKKSLGVASLSPTAVLSAKGKAKLLHSRRLRAAKMKGDEPVEAPVQSRLDLETNPPNSNEMQPQTVLDQGAEVKRDVLPKEEAALPQNSDDKQTLNSFTEDELKVVVSPVADSMATTAPPELEFAELERWVSGEQVPDPPSFWDATAGSLSSLLSYYTASFHQPRNDTTVSLHDEASHRSAVGSTQTADDVVRRSQNEAVDSKTAGDKAEPKGEDASLNMSASLSYLTNAVATPFKNVMDKLQPQYDLLMKELPSIVTDDAPPDKKLMKVASQVQEASSKILKRVASQGSTLPVLRKGSFKAVSAPEQAKVRTADHGTGELFPPLSANDGNQPGSAKRRSARQDGSLYGRRSSSDQRALRLGNKRERKAAEVENKPTNIRDSRKVGPGPCGTSSGNNCIPSHQPRRKSSTSLSISSSLSGTQMSNLSAHSSILKKKPSTPSATSTASTSTTKSFSSVRRDEVSMPSNASPSPQMASLNSSYSPHQQADQETRTAALTSTDYEIIFTKMFPAMIAASSSPMALPPGPLADQVVRKTSLGRRRGKRRRKLSSNRTEKKFIETATRTMRDEATGTVVQDTLTMEVTIAEHGNPGTSSVEELPVGMDDMRLQSGNSTSNGSQSPILQERKRAPLKRPPQFLYSPPKKNLLARHRKDITADDGTSISINTSAARRMSLGTSSRPFVSAGTSSRRSKPSSLINTKPTKDCTDDKRGSLEKMEETNSSTSSPTLLHAVGDPDAAGETGSFSAATPRRSTKSSKSRTSSSVTALTVMGKDIEFSETDSEKPLKENKRSVTAMHVKTPSEATLVAASEAAPTTREPSSSERTISSRHQQAGRFALTNSLRSETINSAHVFRKLGTPAVVDSRSYSRATTAADGELDDDGSATDLSASVAEKAYKPQQQSNGVKQPSRYVIGSSSLR